MAPDRQLIQRALGEGIPEELRSALNVVSLS
jgi:hypothetical protein